MIAPCGINCSVCIGYLREKNKCPGCNAPEGASLHHCQTCKIKHCENKKKDTDYCYKCILFPCARIKHIDKRYRIRYRTSLINNQLYIKEHGIRKFLSKEKEKWICNKCNNVISIHKTECLNCGNKYEVELNYDDSRTN
jgi:hypothetical protein